MINFLKSKKIIFILFFLIVLLLLISLATNKKIEKTEEIKKESLYYHEIKPGESNQENVLKNLGEPKSKFEQDNYEIFSYPNLKKKWNDQIFFKEEKVELIIQQVSEEDYKKKSQFLNQYGQPEIILYGNLSPTFNLLGYPSYGFSIIASSLGENLFQIWYFKATSVEDFIQNIAIPHSYSINPPEEKE